MIIDFYLKIKYIVIIDHDFSVGGHNFNNFLANQLSRGLSWNKHSKDISS